MNITDAGEPVRVTIPGICFYSPMALTMKHFTLLIAIAITFSAATAQDKKPAENAKADELQKFQGAWKITTAEFSGKVMTPKEVGIDTIEVKDQMMTLKNGNKEVASYPFEVFPDKKPKGLIWHNEKQKADLPLIYEIDGAKLRICFPLLPANGAKEPPTPPANFDTKDKPLGLLIAERAKP